jgi:hypothetical protein
MPISSTHPDYNLYTEKWERCRDANEGQDAIKAKGAKYLPWLSEQTQGEYQAYKDRALFFSITRKTIGSLVGMATVRQPMIEFPEEMNMYYSDDNGIEFYEVMTNALAENILMGRVGHLIDWPVAGGKARVCRYVAESIINWETDDYGNPTMVVLKECVLVQVKDDPYLKEYVDQYRKLGLDSAGLYYQETYTAKNELITTIYPVANGKAIDFIPFYVINPFGLGFNIEVPPVLDIVDINLSHYRTSADLEHGRHFTALPTAVISGAGAEDKLRVGSTTAWILPDPNARAVYLEFTGQGLQSLEKALTEKQSQLASMSARLLDNSRRGSESPDTVRLRYASETASLTMIVRATESALNRMYKDIAKFEGLDPKTVVIELNKEFLDSRMSSTQVVDLVESFIEGGISEETLVYNLRRGDVLSIGRSDEDEIASIKAAKLEKVKAAEKAQLAKARPANNLQ